MEFANNLKKMKSPDILKLPGRLSNLKVNYDQLNEEATDDSGTAIASSSGVSGVTLEKPSADSNQSSPKNPNLKKKKEKKSENKRTNSSTRNNP